MKSNILVILTILIIFFSLDTNAQTDTAKASLLYKEALMLYNSSMHIDAAKKLRETLKYNSKHINAYYLLSAIYYENAQYQATIDLLKKGIDNLGDKEPKYYYLIATTEYRIAKYSDAKSHIEKYLKFKNLKENERKKAENISANIKFSLEAIKHPVEFIPVNLGGNVNSAYDEYLPSLTIDEQTLVFTVKLPNKKSYLNSENYQEDFFISKNEDGKWTKSIDMGSPVNTIQNEGGQSISANGRFLFFTASKRADGLGDCDIYYSYKTDNEWSIPMNLGLPVNTKYWDSQPSISFDGKTLYFSSDRPGGFGGSDIWKSSLDSDNKWTNPINLGNTINTIGFEISPFIHPDNQTFYFSSNGLTGMGGYDLYISRLDEKGNWSIPENLGYPINTSKDEISIIVNSLGNTAYFASERDGGYGKKDLYQFELYKKIRPSKVSYLKGKIFDFNTKKKLIAKFELIDLESGNIVIKSFSDSINGEFLIPLPSDKNYALNVSCDGYLFNSQNFSLKNITTNEPYLIDIPLHNLKIGEKVILNNIFFELDSFQLKKESKIELDKVTNFLKQNSNIKIEISGHTDNTGSKEHNLTLSQNRAKSVYNYLIANGITSNCLTYKGYGDTQPVDLNTTEQGRAKNRRTEIKIIELK